MIEKGFINSTFAYEVKASDANQFLKECEAEGLMWSHGSKPTEFDPINFYEGENIQYLAPIQKVDDRNKVYIKCFYGLLYFSFHYNWNTQPYSEYRRESHKQ